MSGDPKTPFNRMASKEATIRREALPDPARVAGSGITTKETLDWLEARSPRTPNPELVVDDPALREEAADQARNEETARAQIRRTRFENRSRKGREDFRTAQRYRGEGRER
ncbi:hypothetical protein [Actibacterium ureilyticum]|uniref:hypothetical protein n=1 Tax=Actibacterium ureilyticum TaxID=1590614 RepID=UPI001140CE7E|nr:hypothetical protein [Actibacterium ureilyticum]